ncbi:MerR family transcriptional regulator [Butyrivibrio hungatei]|uniref:MerR family transcriptional regulator n=1 Tax=Butyrivibrio hungatei TaxID=185008 RepID=A0A1D9P4G6_9FIRM|nr:MerR family transcriptional regulator [Butyrivibrio hungatei]AOZ97411.1 MerR family transcriptional regulator [Butyrivibrio hungatei]
MMTVHEVSKLSGVSVRTLQYYDKIGLLKPAKYTDAKYRLYDEAELQKLQQIMFFKELEFPLKDIQAIVNSADFDRNKALNQQIKLLQLKKEHIENLITVARTMQTIGFKHAKLDFSVFDSSKLDEYSKRAKEQWQHTPQYKEYAQKTKGWTKEHDNLVMENFMKLFVEMGKLKDLDPACDEAQEIVQKMKDYITDNLYTCTNDILYSLGKIYDGGGEFTENIDKAGGKGTGAFTYQAIKIYCGKK